MGTGGNSALFPASAGETALSPAVLDAVPCLIAVVERDSGAVVHLNRAYEDVTGRSAGHLLGACWDELVEPADRATMRTALAGPGGPVSGVETGVRTENGEVRRVLWSVSAAGAGPEGSDLVVLSGIDVTPELRASGLFSQLMRTAATPALVATDLEGRVTLYNSAAERMLGFPAASMIGRKLDVGLFDPAEFAERAQRLGVPPDLRLLTADLTKLDRRRSSLDLGMLDRRRRRSGDDAGERRSGPQGSDDRRAGDRRASSEADESMPLADRRQDRRGTAADRRSGPSPQARDWTLVRQDGQRFTASLVVVKVTDSAGQVVGHLAVAHDVTEQRKSRNLLVAGLEKEAEAVRRLKQLDRAKDDFVATVSHELRTPMTSILGYVEILLDSVPADIDPTHVEMLRAVRRNGHRLRALADDLLTLSSFESGEFALHATEVDLRDVVRRVQEALHPLVADRRMDTSFEVPPYAVLVTGDAAHLERVLFNLLSNALKFTEDGGSVGLALRSDEQEAVLEVSDTGIGIPADEQAQLFTRFFRSRAAQERAVQGSGMGLAIVSTIVQRHGGEVRVVSEEHVGTTVSVHLPLTSG